MIVDSSALVSILRTEPGSEVLLRSLNDAATRSMSAATALEVALVQRPQRYPELDEYVREAAITIVPFDAEQMRIAREAHARYGRGSGSRARLNFGDCISYALAKVTGEPLLFKGDDFRHTDVTPAM